MIKIAKAEKTSDFASIIRLIYETDDYIYPSMCGSDYKLFETIMQTLLLTDSIFSYKNIIFAGENDNAIGLLLYFEKNCELPKKVDNYIKVTKKQAENFESVIQEYFTPLLSKIEDNSIYINNLCVDKDNRRRGVAGKLIDHLLQTFPDKKIVLDCLEENTAAINFYLKFGFKITEHFLGFSGTQEEQINCLKLEYMCIV